MAPKVLGRDGFYGWVNIAVMFFFNIALMPMLMGFTFFISSWVKEFDWSRGVFSGAQTLSLILSGLAAPMVAIFIMKRGAKWSIAIGNLLSIAGLMLLAFQNHIWQLYLGMGVLLGLGVSFGGMLAMMTVINNWFIVKRPMALSISMASMGFSGIIVNPSMMALIEAVGWRNTYLILAALGLIFCVIVPALLLKNRPEDLGQVPDGPVSEKSGSLKQGGFVPKNLYKTPVDFTAGQALRTLTLWLIVIYSALRFFVMMGVGAHIIAFQGDIGISPVTAGWMGSIFAAAMGISQLGVGFLGLRVKMHTLIVGGMIIGLTGFSMLLFADSVPWMIAYSTLYGISSGIGSVAVGNLYPDYFGRTEFPKIMGYTMPVTTFISAFGVTFAGHMYDIRGSYIPAFKIMLGMLVVSGVSIILAKPPVHPSLKGNA